MRLDKHAPLVGVPACAKDVDGLPFHAVGDKYVAALVEAAGVLPLLIPALGDLLDGADLVDRLDGLMLTGSVSNVATHHYGGPPDRPDSPQDVARDATTLPLIQAALAAGLPLFCICRGLQELNVALGGTLHTEIHRVPGRLDHRSLPELPYEEKYGPRHPVLVTQGGRLAALVGAGPIAVNSLHWQAIDRPADRLTIEGRAPDGTIEAVSVRDATGFALAVQWHPEFKPLDNPVSRQLFAAFGAAARTRAAARRTRRPKAA
jgi:putative glutamine amidotransferase